MLYRVTYLEQARKDAAALGSIERKKIGSVVEKKLTTYPATYGKPLHAPQQGFWSLRVGLYRIIYTIEKDLVTVYSVGHRGSIYS
jgi:mRNA-degrading endonuclease RelE of RelBE toxin-antitoxin system